MFGDNDRQWCFRELAVGNGKTVMCLREYGHEGDHDDGEGTRWGGATVTGEVTFPETPTGRQTGEQWLGPSST